MSLCKCTFYSARIQHVVFVSKERERYLASSFCSETSADSQLSDPFETHLDLFLLLRVIHLSLEENIFPFQRNGSVERIENIVTLTKYFQFHFTVYGLCPRVSLCMLRVDFGAWLPSKMPPLLGAEDSEKDEPTTLRKTLID